MTGKPNAKAALGSGSLGRPIPLEPLALLYPAEAAELLAMSEKTLEQWRHRKCGPPVFRPGGGRWVRYRRKELFEWLNASAKERDRMKRSVVANEPPPQYPKRVRSALPTIEDIDDLPDWGA